MNLTNRRQQLTHRIENANLERVKKLLHFLPPPSQKIKGLLPGPEIPLVATNRCNNAY